MSSLCRFGDKVYVLTKGAPEMMLQVSSSWNTGESEEVLTDAIRADIREQDARWASAARRNLAYAYKEVTDQQWEKRETAQVESDLIFL